MSCRLIETLDLLAKNNLEGIFPVLPDTETLWLINAFLRPAVIRKGGPAGLPGYPWRQMSEVGDIDSDWVNAGVSDLWNWLRKAVPFSTWYVKHRSEWSSLSDAEAAEKTAQDNFGTRLAWMKWDVGEKWLKNKKRSPIDHRPPAPDSKDPVVNAVATPTLTREEADSIATAAARVVAALEELDGAKLPAPGPKPPSFNTHAGMFFESILWEWYPLTEAAGKKFEATEWTQTAWQDWRNVASSTGNDRRNKKVLPAVARALSVSTNAEGGITRGKHHLANGKHALDLLRIKYLAWKPEFVVAERFQPARPTGQPPPASENEPAS